MEKCTLKRSSTESSENGGDGYLHRKRARQDGDDTEPEVSQSQSTLEYQMSDPPSHGEPVARSPYELNGKYGGAKRGAGAELEDSGSDTSTVVISEQSQSEDIGNAGSEVDPQTDILSESPRMKWKNTSLIRDADTVAAVIPSANENLVFNTLEKHRADPDRLNIVTAVVLDSSTDMAAGGDAGLGDQQQTAAGSESAQGDVDAGGSSGSSVDSSHYTDVKKVVQKVKATQPHVHITAAEVTTLLEKHKERADRVEFVADILTQNGEHSTLKSRVSVSDDIFTQAMKLNTEFPGVDPSAIYDLLEKAGDQTNLLQSVRETLAKKTGSTKVSTKAPSLIKNDSIPDDLRNDLVYRDMRTISKMFPEKDQNEIYALLEAHYYKPDRVQVVIEELLRSGHWSQGDGDTSSLSHSQSLDVAADTSSAHLQSALHPLPGDLQSDVDHLRDVFPDCDPNYIYERLEANKSSADRVRILAAEMFERRDYPQLKEVIEKQTKQARRQRLQRLDITIEDFLAKFPDPSTTFRDEEKEMKESYKAHVTAQLRHDFPDFKMSYIRSALERHKSHYLHTVQELEAKMDDILVNGGRSRKLRPSPRAEALSYPDEPDEYFFYELWFSRNEQKVKDYFSQKEAARKAKVEAARTNNELYECGCCFEDECLFEEMNACADGHLFCRQCIARSVEAAFGEGKTAFPCLTGSCEHQIPLSVLKDVLPSTMFSKMLRKMQEEEVRQAGIPDLVECPFCSFATIMANPEDRVFRCLNPECLRDSCRLCREPNHVPLKCEEVEKQNETDMRTFIEKRVTEAMLRKCHRCSKRFVKDVGCNKMTCICGATSCYICREPDIDYDHFNEGRCGEGDMNMVHQREMEEAAQKAKEEYLRDHPEAADINLKYDPMQHVNTEPSNPKPLFHFGLRDFLFVNSDHEIEEDTDEETEEDTEEDSDEERDEDREDDSEGDSVEETSEGTDVGNPFGHDHDDGYDDDEGSIIDSDARDDSYSDSDDPYW